MALYVSDEWYGKVDVIPGLCYLETEFVSVFWFPLLPRRSRLVFPNVLASGGEAFLPIRLSLKSVFVAWARIFCVCWAVFGFGFLFTLAPETPPNERLLFVLATGTFAAIPCLLLWLLWRWSRASRKRREQLAAIEGLPAPIAAAIRGRSLPEPSAPEEPMPTQGPPPKQATPAVTGEQTPEGPA